MDDALSRHTGYSLRRAAGAMIGELAKRLATIDLRVTEATVLLLIGDRRNLTASAIGRTLDIQRANMVPLLNRLEASGLITRQAIDGKSQAIVLTPAGLDRRARAETVTQAFEADLIARVPVSHRDHLLPALDVLWR